MAGKTKLELTWIGKENRPKLEPRILLEDPVKSYHAAHRVTDSDIFDNRLIHADNLLALKALDQVAYVRFASVYKQFEDATQFKEIVNMLRRRSSKSA